MSYRLSQMTSVRGRPPHSRSPNPWSSSRTSSSSSTSSGSQRHFTTSHRSDSRKDLYKALKLPKNATKQQIKAKFYEMSKKTHPDAPGGSAEKFHEINEAYETLGDPSKRRTYDLSLSSPSSSSSSGGYSSGYASPFSSPNSNPYARNSSSQSAWSTRRPPPRYPGSPNPFANPYQPFGRHTPPNYSGASSGSYGDPYAHVREQFRQSYADVRSGKHWAFQGGAGSGSGSGSGSGGSGSGSAKSSQNAEGPSGEMGKRDQGGGVGRILGVLALLLVVVSFGGTLTTVRAEDGYRDKERKTPEWGDVKAEMRYQDGIDRMRYEQLERSRRNLAKDTKKGGELKVISERAE